MGADLNNIVRTQKLTDEHVQFLVYQILRGLKVSDLAKQLSVQPIIVICFLTCSEQNNCCDISPLDASERV